jgi:mono/diheme cytochrome c family protein
MLTSTVGLGAICGASWLTRAEFIEQALPTAPDLYGANPVALTDDNLIAGIELYARHCAVCHGTTQGNASASPVAKGLHPQPPQLASDGVEAAPRAIVLFSPRMTTSSCRHPK